MTDEIDPARRNLDEAKRLLRITRIGSLATLDGGAPLTSLIGVASDWDGAPLFLTSSLARHAQNLMADDRASVLLAEPADRGDPLNSARLTLQGRIGRHPLPEQAMDRYLRRNPKAKLYAGFADFSLQRMEISGAFYVGGFGRATPVALTELLLAGDARALEGAQDELLRHAQELLEARSETSSPRAWRAAGLDPEGLDLSSGIAVSRIAFGEARWEPAAWLEAFRAAMA